MADQTQFPGAVGDFVSYWIGDDCLICKHSAPRRSTLIRVPVLAISPKQHDIIVPYGHGWVLSKTMLDGFHKNKYVIASDFDKHLNTNLGDITHDTWVLYGVGNKQQATKPVVRNAGDPYIDGACCIKCGTFAVYAAVGHTCFSCRSDHYRSSTLMIDDDDWA